MNKKEWLDKLYYDYGNQNYDFELCAMYKKGKETIASKWKKYSKIVTSLNPSQSEELWRFNNRTILPNEIVLDIEDPKRYSGIYNELIKRDFDFLAYKTGSKGYHIHIFFKHKFQEKNKSYFINKFGTDMLKAGKRTMIALEFCPHWKTGNEKELIYGKIK